MKCGCKQLLKAINAYLAKADSDMETDLEENGYVEAALTVEMLNKIEDSITAALNDEADTLLKKLNDVIDIHVFFEEKWPDFKDTDDLSRKLFELFRDEFSTYMPHLIDGYVIKTNPNLKTGKISQRTSAWIETWSKQLADMMQLDTHFEIESILKIGIEEGQGAAEIARAISDSGIREPGYRARRVAVTETLRIHSYAHQEAMMQSPVVVSKKWRHTGSYRNAPRANHVKMDGIIIPKGERFTLVGADGRTYTPLIPHDVDLPAGETVNCKCFCQDVLDEDAFGLSPDEIQTLQEEAIAEMDDEWEAELNRKNRESTDM